MHISTAAEQYVEEPPIPDQQINLTGAIGVGLAALTGAVGHHAATTGTTSRGALGRSRALSDRKRPQNAQPPRLAGSDRSYLLHRLRPRSVKRVSVPASGVA